MVRITFEDFDTPQPAESTTPGLRITEAAAQQIMAVFARRNRPEGTFLRIAVQGGGCNGFSYHFSFETSQKANDVATVEHGVTVMTDAESFKLLAGSTIDFEETLEASQFVIKNPNAKTSCGCGNSFSI